MSASEVKFRHAQQRRLDACDTAAAAAAAAPSSVIANGRSSMVLGRASGISGHGGAAARASMPTGGIGSGKFAVASLEAQLDAIVPTSGSFKRKGAAAASAPVADAPGGGGGGGGGTGATTTLQPVTEF